MGNAYKILVENLTGTWKNLSQIWG